VSDNVDRAAVGDGGLGIAEASRQPSLPVVVPAPRLPAAVTRGDATFGNSLHARA